jgi:hypothetical protein
MTVDMGKSSVLATRNGLNDVHADARAEAIWRAVRTDPAEFHAQMQQQWTNTRPATIHSSKIPTTRTYLSNSTPAQASEPRVSQMPVGRPLDELDFRHQVGLHRHSLLHLLRR